MTATRERTGAADLSVVVAAFSGEAALVRCLDAVEACIPAAEVIVGSNADAAAIGRLAERFPRVRFVACDERTTVFRLRSAALPHAQGATIALLEDHCTVTPTWVDAVRAARGAGFAVIGGPIDNGLVHRTYDWSLYFCEYSAYMPPLPQGPVEALLAANVAYDRDALFGCRQTWEEGFYENEVHDAIRSAGGRLVLSNDAKVLSHLAMTLRQAMGHLYAGGRRFGGYRRSRSSGLMRLLWPLATPLIPVVWFGRIARRVAQRRPGRLVTLVLGMPYVMCMLLAWATGEAVGLIAPTPKGSSV